MSSVEKQPLREAIREEEEKEAAEEKILGRKALLAQRKTIIPTLILGIAGVTFTIGGLLVGSLDPGGESIVGHRFPYLAVTLVIAGFFCIKTAFWGSAPSSPSL